MFIAVIHVVVVNYVFYIPGNVGLSSFLTLQHLAISWSNTFGQSLGTFSWIWSSVIGHCKLIPIDMIWMLFSVSVKRIRHVTLCNHREKNYQQQLQCTFFNHLYISSVVKHQHGCYGQWQSKQQLSCLSGRTRALLAKCQRYQRISLVSQVVEQQLA